MTTGEATKTRSAALLDGIKSSTWGSRIAVVLTTLLLVLLPGGGGAGTGAVYFPATHRADQRRDPGARGPGLHAGLRDHRADQLRPRRQLHDRLLRRPDRPLGYDLRPRTFLPYHERIRDVLEDRRCPYSLFVAMVACGLLNVGIERVAYKPLRNAPRLAVLITAIGMSFILQNVGLIWKGPAQVPFPELISNANILPGDTIIFRWKDLFVVLVTVPLLLALSYFIGSTRQGKAMRAVAQDKEAAAMVGINVNRTISITFLLGGILAGASGVMYGLFNGITVFNVGFTQGLYAFTAAVLGGIGNLTGAVVGGLLIGIIGAMADQYIGARWTPIVIFSVLILVLVFRPRGLLGDRSAVQGGGE